MNWARRLVMMLLIVGCLGLSQVWADTIFPTRAGFDAAFPGAQIENWDSSAAGTTIANGGTLNGITYNSSAGVSVITNQFLATTPPNSLGRTPNQFFDSPDTITFSFGSPINTFGIDINTFATG